MYQYCILLHIFGSLAEEEETADRGKLEMILLLVPNYCFDCCSMYTTIVVIIIILLWNKGDEKKDSKDSDWDYENIIVENIYYQRIRCYIISVAIGAEAEDEGKDDWIRKRCIVSTIIDDNDVMPTAGGLVMVVVVQTLLLE